MAAILIRKWNLKTRRQYEMSIQNPMEVQDFENLEFMRHRFQVLEALKQTKKIPEKTLSKEQKICRYCNRNHSIHTCLKFTEISVDERAKFTKDKQLCYNCLNHNFNKKCFSQSRCRICNKAHSTLLHKDIKKKNATSSKTHVGLEKSTVLLATAMIKVKTASGSYEYLRALVDPGSQVLLITEEAASLLSLPREKVQAEISGLGAGQPNVSKQKITTQCLPRFSSKFVLNTKLLILQKLTDSLPEKKNCSECRTVRKYYCGGSHLI